MKMINFSLSMLRPVRFVIVAFTIALLFLSSAFPVAAIGTSKSNVTEATDQLLETQRKTDKIAKSAPASLKEVEERSSEGLNEIQGDADIDKMKRPDNSQDATSVEDEVNSFLKKVTGNK
jgi:hypothetical protein